MKADYVHKDTLTATDYVELNKNNELLMSYNQALLKENQELKKQLEEKENQQKEFIEYIASYIELLNDKPDLVELSQKDVLEEILEKYKSIIGVSDE